MTQRTLTMTEVGIASDPHPVVTLKSKDPETERKRVGGGFQIYATDPVSKASIGMDRYLKR